MSSRPQKIVTGGSDHSAKSKGLTKCMSSAAIRTMDAARDTVGRSCGGCGERRRKRRHLCLCVGMKLFSYATLCHSVPLFVTLCHSLSYNHEGHHQQDTLSAERHSSGSTVCSHALGAHSSLRRTCQDQDGHVERQRPASTISCTVSPFPSSLRPRGIDPKSRRE